MGRPAKFDRDEAVQIALDAFWSDGYEASSVKALSEKMGMTRSSFYNAFGTREALFRETLRFYAERSPDRTLDEADFDDTGWSVRALITRTFANIVHVRGQEPDGRGCMIVNAITELADKPDHEIGRLVCELIQGSTQRFQTLLEWGVDRGELPPDYPVRDSALALQNLMVGMNVMAKVDRTEAGLRQISDITLKGLGLYQSPGPAH